MEDYEEKCEESTTECVRFLPKRRTQILSAFIATLGSFGLGTVYGWSSPAIPQINESGDLGELSESQKGFIASCALLGALLSPPLAATLMNRIGRKYSMLCFAIPSILGWILIGFASSLWLIYAGRFITGLCGGAFMTIVPLYVGEIAEKTIRGALSTLMILMLVSGVFFSSVLGAVTNWSLFSFILISVPALLLALLQFLPETPRYYISKGDKDNALKSLLYLRGATRSSQVQKELQSIQENYGQDVDDSVSWRDLFVPSSLKPIIISLFLIFFQQLCGANAVSFRQVEVIESAGTGWDPNLVSSVISGIQVLLVLVPTFTVDRIGRKILMIGSELIMILGLVGLAVFFYFKDNAGITSEELEKLGWLPLTSLVLFTVGYNVGMGPIPFVVSAELLPSQSRGLATAVVIEFYYILSTLATFFFGSITEMLGWTLSYGGFAGICVLGVTFILVIVPETKGKSNEQIELLFKRKSTVRKVSIRSSIRSGQMQPDSDSGPGNVGVTVTVNNVDESSNNSTRDKGRQQEQHRNSVVFGVDNPAFQSS